MRPIALAVVLLALGLPARAGAAAPLELREVGRVETGIVRSDGERYVGSARLPGGPVELRNVRTGQRRTVPTPAGCDFADVHHATVLWSCGTSLGTGFGSGVLLDLRTGTWSTAPALDESTAPDIDNATYDQVGDRWVRMTASGYHFSGPVYVDRATGRQAPPTEMQADGTFTWLPVDLDDPALTRPLCPGHRLAMVEDTSFFGVEPATTLARSGTWAAATTFADEPDRGYPARVELQRCGRAPRTIAWCVVTQCSKPELTSEVVAWTAGEGRAGSRLVVRELAGGRTRRSRLVPGDTTLLRVGTRIYVAAGGRLLRAIL